MGSTYTETSILYRRKQNLISHVQWAGRLISQRTIKTESRRIIFEDEDEL